MHRQIMRGGKKISHSVFRRKHSDSIVTEGSFSKTLNPHVR
jgi:hypothetical protein